MYTIISNIKSGINQNSQNWKQSNWKKYSQINNPSILLAWITANRTNLTDTLLPVISFLTSFYKHNALESVDTLPIPQVVVFSQEAHGCCFSLRKAISYRCRLISKSQKASLIRREQHLQVLNCKDNMIWNVSRELASWWNII